MPRREARSLRCGDLALQAEAIADGQFIKRQGMRLVGASPEQSEASEAFPVGYVFISVVNTNPADLVGYGTWAAFGAGRVLVGYNAADSDFDTGEKTGGAKTVTLTAAQSGLPQHTHTQNAHTHVQDAHNHTQDAHSHNQASQTATTGGVSSWEHGTIDTSSTAAETLPTSSTTATNQAATAVNQNATAVNQNAGPTDASQAHSNVQPYITVFMFKRTA